VLDEPANHLDIDSRAELIKSLNAYEGAVLIISHDRNLLEAVVDRLWLVDKGSVTTYDGSLEDYRALQLEKDRSNRKQNTGEADSRKQSRKDTAEARKRLAPKTPDKAVKLGQERARLIRVIETLEMEWLEALERYEAAKSQEGLD